MHVFCPALLVTALAWCVEAAIVDSTQQTIYDRGPKLRLRGGPFPDDESQIHLTFLPPLQRDVDYKLVVASDTVLVLQLQEGKRWANVDGSTGPQPIVLIEYKDDSNPDAAKGFQGAIVAQVIPMPEVHRSEQVIYEKASNYLYINGTALGSKEFSPYFDPPLLLDIDYKVTSQESSEVRLSLLPGARWRSEPGPLYLRGLDTGAGLVRVGGDQGVLVAEVQADLDGHGVTVDTNERKIYQTEAELVIRGEGFNSEVDGNSLRFRNNLIGGGVNYTIVGVADDELKLRLAPGSVWRKDGENLPGPLLLLAVDAGDGYVAVGPTAAKKGRVVATVYETPTVTASTVKISRTQSHELNVLGLGFPVGGARDMELEFDPPLQHDVDYELRVVSRNQIRLLLKDDKAWGPVGSLKLKYISSIGPSGRIPLKGTQGIQIAEIVQDAGQTGGMVVNQAEQKIYQSALHNTITITGTGFKQGMQLVFDNELDQGVDFDVKVNPTSLLLSLKKDKVWASKSGPLTLKSVKIDGETYDLAHGQGVRVATVFMNPSIDEQDELLHETQSKSIWVYGSGFTDTDRMHVKLTPTPDEAYYIAAVTAESFRILLNEGQSWFPSFGTEGADKPELQISMIDTGAGSIELDKLVTIANIISDVEGVECDDSCEFSFDGICDDYSTMEGPKLGWGYDDDFGGTYGDLDVYGVDDDYTVPACYPGTDCTDCGGLDAQATKVICENTCAFPRDGTCDDPRGASYCALGTDCQDCGPVGAPNFTMVDDTYFDDDDDMWAGQDLPDPKHRSRTSTSESGDPGGSYVKAFDGIALIAGIGILAIASWLGWVYEHNEI